MADERNTELVIRAKNLTNDAFGAATGNLDKLKGKAKDASEGSANSFGKMEKSLRQFDDVLELAGGPHLRDVIQGVGQLGDVASGASGQLGGLAKAGLVASAAMAGWQIGRKIAEFTGSDKLIGDATAKLLGWGDAAGVVAAQKADVLARASKNAGRQITDLNEAVKINEQVTTKAVNAMAQLHAPAESVKVVAEWRSELEKLKSAGVLDALRKDLESNNFSQGELAKRYRVSSDAVQLFNRDLDAQQKASEKATKATDEHAKKIKDLAAAFSGTTAIEKAAEAIEALHLAQKNGIDISQMTTAQQKALGDAVREAIDVYEKWGQAVPPELHAIALATRAMSESQIKDLQLVTKALADMEKGLLNIPHNVQMQLASRDLRGLNLTPGDNTAAQDARSNLIHALGDSTPNLFGRIFGTPEQFGAGLSSTILGAIQGGGNPVSSAAGLVGGKVATHIATSLTDKGSKLFQTALGGVLNSALPVIGSLAGPLLDKLWGSLFGTKGRDTKNSMAEQFFGSTGEMQRKMVETLSKADYDRLWAQFSKVGQNNSDQAVAAIDAIRAALDKQKASQDAVATSAKAKADAIAAAEQKAADAVSAVQKQIDSIDKQVADLDASEAVEENMGIVERNTRDALAKQRDALTQELEATKANGEAAVQALRDTATAAFDKMTEAVDRLTDALNGIPAHTNYTVSGTYESGGYTGGRPGEAPETQHAEGAYIREDHTARVHAGEMIGPPAFFAAALARAMAAHGSSPNTLVAQPIHVQIDGKTIAYFSMKYRGQVLAPMGR